MLRKLQDITIASEIYNSSQQADLILWRHPRGNGDDVARFRGAQNQWVQAATARSLLLNVSSIAGGPASHVLANFSVTRQKGFESEGIPELLKDLKDQMKLYEVTIRSGGKVSPGGHAKPMMAAKGVLDWQEQTPSRTWVVTGMGANASTGSHGNGTGGRGKSVKFYASPLFSGAMTGFRLGIWQSGNSIGATGPFPMLGGGAF